jgi:uncharacterized protein YigA (DUF484 family)
MTYEQDKVPSKGANSLPKKNDVRAFLKENPGFLIDNPDLVEYVMAPQRQSGGGVVDMQSFMIERLQGEVASLRVDHGELVAASRSNMISQSRIHAAVLSILEASTFEHMIEVVTTDLANMLDVEVSSLCVECNDKIAVVPDVTGVHIVSPGMVDETLGPGRDIVLRAKVEAEHAVFGGAVGLVHSAALLRLPISPFGPMALLAFGSRDEDRFHPGQGTELLSFLSRVLTHTMREWLDLPR